MLAVDRARQLIEVRIAEIEEERSKLAGALKSLGERIPSRPSRSGQPRRPAAMGVPAPSKTRQGPRRNPKRKRAPRGRRREELLSAIKVDPGARPVELARSIGVPPSQVHGLIAKARAERLIVKRGKGYALKN